MSAGATSNGRLAANVTLGIDLSSASSGITAGMFGVSRLEVGEAQPVLVSGQIKQLMVPTASLTDISVAPDGSSASVNVYDPAGATMSGGLWIPNGSPFVTYTFTFTDTGATRTITLQETRPGQTPQEQPFSSITWTAATNAISVAQGSAAGTGRIESRTETVDQAARTRTIEVIIRNSDNQVLSKERTISRKFVWGEEVIETIVDPDPGGKQLSTKYSYYNDVLPTEGAWGSLRTVVYPDGRWEFHDYNNAGMNTLLQRPWKDGPVPSINLSTASSDQVRAWAGSVQGQCWTSRTHYSGTPLQTEYLGSEEWIGHDKISQSISNETTGVVEMANVGLLKYRTVTTTNVSGRFADVVSDVSTFDYGAPEPWGGRTRRVLQANGNVDSYSYVKGDYNAATKDVAQNNGGTARKETTVHYKDGSNGTVPGKTTRDVRIYDKELLIVSQLWVYTPESTWAKLDETLYEYWPDGNLKKETKSNGRIVREQTWINGRLMFEVDESGLQTNYAYDGVDRLFRTTKVGAGGRPNLITETEYDALDRPIKVKIQAQGNSEIIDISTQYNIAGETVSTTDETGLTTNYTTTAGGAVRTTTLPSGATRVETNYLDGQLKSVSGTSGSSSFMDYSVVDGLLTTAVYLGTSNQVTQPSLRWSRTFVDWSGRVVKEERPGFGGGSARATLHSYNDKGQLTATHSPGLSPLLYEYDAYGHVARQGSDWTNEGLLDTAGHEPVIEHDQTYIKEGNIWYHVNSAYEYRLAGNNTPSLVEQIKTQMTGLTNTTIARQLITDAAGVVATVTTTVDRPSVTVTEKVTRNDCAVNRVGNAVTVAGLRMSRSEPTSTHTTTFTYDHLERQITSTSSLSGTRTFSYSPGTRQLATEYDALNQATAYSYYGQGEFGAGQVKSKSGADNKACRYGYDGAGRLVRQWGDADYPMELEYNGMGEMQYLRTYRGGTGWTGTTWPDAVSRGTADVTEWTYDPASGWLQAKTDAAGKSVSYSYTPAGMLSTRTWARGVVTSYTYDPSGRRIATRYSDATPAVLLVLDRAGRPSQVIDGSGTATVTWMPDGKEDSLTYTHGPLAQLSVDRSFDNFHRKTGISVTQSAVSLHGGNYEYDDRSRLANVTHGLHAATYSYHGTKGVPQTIAFKDNGTTVYSDITDHDTIGRISNRRIVTPTPVVTLNRITYTVFDAINRPKEATREDGGIWKYNYNDRGEVTLAEKYRNTTSRYGGMRWGYGYDNLGNRTMADQGSNGGLTGELLLQHAYANSELNQYSTVTSPTSLYVTGATVDATTTVQINATNARRQGTYFWLPVAAANGSSANRLNVTVAGTGTTQSGSYTGSLLVPPASASFVYDLDGNLTSDGLWTYTWDGENRLRAMETVGTLPEASRIRLEFAYDYLGRRVQKTRYRWQSGGTPGYATEATLLFLYDGWNLVAELNSKHELVRGYLWGLDTSGAEREAGGIGGVVFSNVTSGPAAGTYTPAYDGNGNVLAYVNIASRTVAGRYDYSPYGERAVQNEVVEGLPPIGFSTKYTDSESNLTSYLHRYYNPMLGRWLNRDPVAEVGGINLYSFLGNNAINRTDYLGLCDWAALAKDRKVLNAIRDVGASGSIAALIKTRYGPSFRPDPRIPGTKHGSLGYDRALASYFDYQKEWGARVCLKCPSGKVYMGGFLEGTTVGAVDPNQMPPCQEGDATVAYLHSHPNRTNITGHTQDLRKATFLRSVNRYRHKMDLGFVFASWEDEYPWSKRPFGTRLEPGKNPTSYAFASVQQSDGGAPWVVASKYPYLFPPY